MAGTGLVLGQETALGEPEAGQGLEGGRTKGRDGRVSFLSLHIHRGAMCLFLHGKPLGSEVWQPSSVGAGLVKAWCPPVIFQAGKLCVVPGTG